MEPRLRNYDFVEVPLNLPAGLSFKLCNLHNATYSVRSILNEESFLDCI